MAKNRPSFGDSAAKGMRDTYDPAPVPTFQESEPETVSRDSAVISNESAIKTSGNNPYYDYHPKTGARGGTLGAPRKDTKRTQISIGCTEDEKQLYKKAATADGRKLPDFVNRAVQEYIINHGLDKLI